jgi:hypothetical protein
MKVMKTMKVIPSVFFANIPRIHTRGVTKKKGVGGGQVRQKKAAEAASSR